MAYLWAQAFSLNEIIHELKISNKTAIEWCTFFRECCISHIIDNSTPIGGNGIEVEIDESKFGKRKYYRMAIRLKANGYLEEERNMTKLKFS